MGKKHGRRKAHRLVRPPRTTGRGEPHVWSAEQIAALLAARQEASDALLALKVSTIDPTLRDPRRTMDRLRRVRGPDLAWASTHPQPMADHFIGELSFYRRRYRRDFALYGGARPYLDTARYDELELEQAKQAVVEILEEADLEPADMPPAVAENLERLAAEASPEELARLTDLLLKDVWLVEDVLPPDPPPRPAGWPAPTGGSYEPPVSELLERGPLLDLVWVPFASADEVWHERPCVPELLRLATDPGLLRAWPAEAAGWAPYHAMALLGGLGAAQVAPELLGVLDLVRDDDWISDHLFLAGLAPMGPAVEPLLWQVARDRHRDLEARGLALLALGDVGEAHPERQAGILADFESFLSENTFRDRHRKSVNAYAAAVLHRRPFDDEAAKAIVRRADAAGRVDRSIHDQAEIDSMDELW